MDFVNSYNKLLQVAKENAKDVRFPYRTPTVGNLTDENGHQLPDTSKAYEALKETRWMEGWARPLEVLDIQEEPNGDRNKFYSKKESFSGGRKAVSEGARQLAIDTAELQPLSYAYNSWLQDLPLSSLKKLLSVIGDERTVSDARTYTQYKKLYEQAFGKNPIIPKQPLQIEDEEGNVGAFRPTIYSPEKGVYRI